MLTNHANLSTTNANSSRTSGEPVMSNKNPKHTTQRNGRYYYYCKVPTQLQSVVGRKMITKSLNTDNYDEATVSAAQMHLEFQDTFKSIVVQLANGTIVTCDTVTEASELVNQVTGSTSIVTPTPVTHLLLSQAIQQYLAYKEPNWSSKSLEDNRAALSLLLVIIGDMSVTNIKATDAEHYRTVLSKLPVFVPKLMSQGYTISQILKLNKPPRSIGTTNKHFILTGGLFNWLTDRDSIIKSYFKKLAIKDTRSVRDIRLPFTPVELVDSFTEHHRLTYNIQSKSSLYYIPLVLLFSGCRLGEVAQLDVSDIDLTNNTISINSLGDKKVKSSSSERLIPIHKSLISLGFLDYCSSVIKNSTNNNSKLFPQLHKMSDGYGQSMGTWWSYNISKKLNVPTLHSLRHSFINQLTQHQVAEHIIAAIVGHKYGGISHNRYSSNYDIEILRSAVDRVEFTLQ